MLSFRFDIYICIFFTSIIYQTQTDVYIGKTKCQKRREEKNCLDCFIFFFLPHHLPHSITYYTQLKNIYQKLRVTIIIIIIITISWYNDYPPIIIYFRRNKLSVSVVVWQYLSEKKSHTIIILWSKFRKLKWCIPTYFYHGIFFSRFIRYNIA